MRNRGTKEGTIAEVEFVKLLNKKEQLSYWHTLAIEPSNHYAIRVTTMKFGELNSKKVFPKADIFIAHGEVELDYLKSKEYFLDEKDLEKFSLMPIKKSGISIKRDDSKKFQIIKMGDSTFKKLFGSNILAAGASIYCRREDEFIKNNELLDGWGVEKEEFLSYFNKNLDLKLTSITDKDIKKELNLIKKFSNKKIEEIILKDKKLQDFIFFGIGNFKEPFTAYWLYEKGEFKQNYIIPFSVTTGSGRSKGDYTIVLKPKL